MNRQHYSLLFVLGACLLLCLAWCPLYDSLLDDKEFFKYTGMALLRGNVPYRDFFDHKPPLIYFIHCAGLYFGPWGLWTINTLLALLTTYLFFQLNKRHQLPFPWLLPLLFNLMIRNPLVNMGINLTREYTAFFTLLFFCILAGRSRYRHFLLGFLSALIFFTQQDQFLLLIPFLIYALISDPAPPQRPVIWLGVGFLSVTVPILLYFASNHGLGYFWEDAFQFNFSVYTAEKKSFGDHFRSIKYALDAINFELPVIIAMILGIAALFMQNKKRGLLIAALVALLLTLSPEFMGGRSNAWNEPGYFITYYLPLSATVCILLFVVFAFTEDKLLTGRKARLPYIFLLCCSLGYTALQNITHLKKNADDPIRKVPELAWLRQQNPGDYQFYVFNNNQYIIFYNELKILAPSRWLYHHFWVNYENWDPDHKILQNISEDLLRHRTAYILMDPATLSTFRNPANRDWWISFMNTWYEPVTVSGSTSHILWRLKNISQ